MDFTQIFILFTNIISQDKYFVKKIMCWDPMMKTGHFPIIV